VGSNTTSAVTLSATSFVEETRSQFEKLLPSYLPPLSAEPKILHEAMHYALMAGGKRIRPLLASAAFQFASGKSTAESSPLSSAIASLEILHTYSLIHDDLPCMDDDDLRRGQPTVHKKFGEAIAVLAGDALHVIAFRLMAETGSLAAVMVLAEAVGTAGMIGGQVADLQAEGKRLTKPEIEHVHRTKTGALIRASVVIGGILANPPKQEIELLGQFGEKIGLAFQIVDDILDLEGDEELLGKPVGSDLKNAKATYPAVVGIDQAKIDARRLIDEAIRLLEMYDSGAKRPPHLIELARFVGERAY
jgi:geranylgeranyl diphosphate synthase type II